MTWCLLWIRSQHCSTVPVQCWGATQTLSGWLRGLNIILCGRCRKSCCVNFLQWAKFPLQLLVPTAGSHLTVPSFVPLQLCGWPHRTPDCRKNASRLLRCRKTSFLNKLWYHEAVHGSASTPLWQHSSDKGSLAVQQSMFTWWLWPPVPNTAHLLHWAPLVLLNPRDKDRLQSYRAPNPGCLLRELSARLAPAKTTPVLVYGPGWSTKHWRTKPEKLEFVFTTPEHRGPLWLLKAAGELELKEDDLLFSSWGWCMPQDCALLPNYNLRKYSDHEWDWWILGDFSTSILGAKLLASCPKLASQPKTEFMIERFIFLSSTVLFPSPTLTINNAQLSCEVN